MSKNQIITLESFSIKKSSNNKLLHQEYNNANLNKTFYDQQDKHTKESERSLTGEKKQKKKENKKNVKVTKININENNTKKDSKDNIYNPNIVIISNTGYQNYFNKNERNPSPPDNYRNKKTQIYNNNLKNYISNSNNLKNNKNKKISNKSYIINMDNKDNMKISKNINSKTIDNINNNSQDDDIYSYNNNSSNNSSETEKNSNQENKNDNTNINIIIINQNILNNNDNYNDFNQNTPFFYNNSSNELNEIDIQNSSKNEINNSKINQYDNIFGSNNSDRRSTMTDSKLLQKKSINKEEEQEMRDTIKKKQIAIKHSSRLSSYYEYENPDEKEKGINELLEEMSIYGDTTKREILKEKKINPNKFISIDEAIEKGNSSYDDEGYQNEYFILALLAKVLMKEGCVVAIERDKPNNEEDTKEKYTTLQFLINGMFNLKKYNFYFDFGEEKNDILLNNLDEQNKFNLKLKTKLSSVLKLNINDIIMCNPRYGSYGVTAIIKKDGDNELTEKKLKKKLSKDPMFSKIKSIEKNILLSGCKLSPSMLDSTWNNIDGGWGINEKRGGKPYYPPLGWIGYGLNVLDKFDYGDNTWLDCINRKGEWTVAYHGVGNKLSKSQIFKAVNSIVKNNLKSGDGQYYKDSNDIFHKGEKVGEGVYITPKPEVMEDYCGEIECGEKNYKIGIMARVNPELIRCPVEKQDYWVINGTDNEIRPYRILIKELN